MTEFIQEYKIFLTSLGLLVALVAVSLQLQHSIDLQDTTSSATSTEIMNTQDTYLPTTVATTGQQDLLPNSPTPSVQTVTPAPKQPPAVVPLIANPPRIRSFEEEEDD